VLPPGRILEVRYEDVVADLEGQARRIIVHCGLEWDTNCLAFHQNERLVRTASATQVRRPIYNSSIGRWHSYESFLSPLVSELGSQTASPTTQPAARISTIRNLATPLSPIVPSPCWSAIRPAAKLSA
jgi:hypothetical protein